MKCADAPTTSKSMRGALADLKLDMLYIVYPGRDSYPLDERISVLPLGDAASVFAAGWTPAALAPRLGDSAGEHARPWACVRPGERIRSRPEIGRRSPAQGGRERRAALAARR